jgi:hypothetical protein
MQQGMFRPVNRTLRGIEIEGTFGDNDTAHLTVRDIETITESFPVEGRLRHEEFYIR